MNLQGACLQVGLKGFGGEGVASVCRWVLLCWDRAAGYTSQGGVGRWWAGAAVVDRNLPQISQPLVPLVDEFAGRLFAGGLED
jgi:hypothetical protein